MPIDLECAGLGPVAAFDDVALRRALAPSVRDAGGDASYGELAGVSRAIASAVLAAVGRGREPVALLFDRDRRLVSAMLGVLRTGRPYLPLDPSHPMARNRRLADLAGIAAILTCTRHRAAAETVAPAGTALIESDALDPAAGPSDIAAPEADTLAYILFTSGSTGRPKAVAFRHRNPLREACEFIRAAGIGPGDRVAFLHSPAVAGAVRVLYGTLLAGASLAMLSPQAQGPKGIAEAIRRQSITVLPTVPVVFRHLLAAAAPGDLASVRLVLLAGDRVDWGDVAAFRCAFPAETELMIAIGATECATAHSQWTVTGDADALGPRLPVGRPIAGKSVAVVDEAGLALPVGAIGEIAVTSAALAAGYWRDPEATARAFRPAGGALRTYRTGDLGRLRPDGLLEFHGRRDHQVKISGFRVEPGEVEAALRALPEVADAAIVVRHGPPAPTLVAYAAVPDELADPRLLLDRLAEALPAHMVPARLFVVARLPYLPGNKVDRAALSAIDAGRAASDRSTSSAPGLEAAVSNLVSRVLQRQPVRPQDSLRSLGVDSLQKLTLSLQLESAFDVTLGDEMMTPSTTVAALAAAVAAARQRTTLL